MNLNKVASDLFFAGSSIKEIKVKNNIINFGNDVDAVISMELETHSIDEIESEKGEKLRGCVNLIIGVKAKNRSNKSDKCEMSLNVEGCFESLSSDTDLFEKMLRINGGTTLYSIARAQIMNISANMFANGKIVLPLINMIEFFEEVEKNREKTK